MPSHSSITLSLQYYCNSTILTLKNKKPHHHFTCFIFTMSNSQTPINKKSKNCDVDDVVSPMSTLPEDILEHVFAFLPIKKAVQASTVSTTFKTSWQYNRKLLFGRDFSIRYVQSDIAAVIDNVFDSHKGIEIQSFTLHIDPIGVQDRIKKWLQIAIEKGVEDLEINLFRPSLTMILRSEFFDSVTKLRNLKLVHCELELPPVFTGMKLLSKLALRHMEITEVMIEQLIAHCKLLAVFDLYNCTGIRQVNILAENHRHFKTLKIGECLELEVILIKSPTLRSIFYNGYAFRVRFDQCATLTEAFFNFVPTRNCYMHNADEVEILVHRLQFVTVLSVSALFLEALAARVRGMFFQGAQYNMLVNLKELQLLMQQGTFCNPYDIFLFLMHCPSLERLFIDLNDYQMNCGMYWEMHQQPILSVIDHNFTQLKMVKLMGFKFFQSELELVKMLLQRATILERLILITPCHGRPKISPRDGPKYRELFNSWKKSSTLNIAFYEHIHDFNSPVPIHPRDW